MLFILLDPFGDRALWSDSMRLLSVLLVSPIQGRTPFLPYSVSISLFCPFISNALYLQPHFSPGHCKHSLTSPQPPVLSSSCSPSNTTRAIFLKLYSSPHGFPLFHKVKCLRIIYKILPLQPQLSPVVTIFIGNLIKCYYKYYEYP